LNTNTTRLIDIPSTILAILLIVGGLILLFFGKVTYVELSFFIVTGVGLVGGVAALKAPSPAQAQQLSTLAETAQTHADQMSATQQQLGQVQELALRAANGVSYIQQQGQAPMQPQGMVNLATMATSAQPQLQTQFIQPVPQPVQYVDYGRHFGDSQVMPAAQVGPTLPYPTVPAQ